jgi:capsular polysaccharide transport system ATP-binding protein
MFKIQDLTKSYGVKGGRHYVFRNVNLEIPAKRNVGIIGANGAGKSTLLRILGGIDYPDSGEIISDCTFSWPLGLRGGFVGHLTGRENCRMVCRMYGLRGKEMGQQLEVIKTNSGIGEYFEEPVKTYSSGMSGRLGFALSLSFDFDYFLIDEITSVGDARFRKMAKAALKEKAATSNVVLVSHSMANIRDFCDYGVYIGNGEVLGFENLEDAFTHYQNVIAAKN